MGEVLEPTGRGALLVERALLLLGSLAMLAGALTRHDGGVVIGVTLVGSIVQALVRTAPEAVPAWMTWLARGLPPIDLADQLRGTWLRDAPPHPTSPPRCSTSATAASDCSAPAGGG